jgi:hypothetical protein
MALPKYDQLKEIHKLLEWRYRFDRYEQRALGRLIAGLSRNDYSIVSKAINFSEDDSSTIKKLKQAIRIIDRNRIINFSRDNFSIIEHLNQVIEMVSQKIQETERNNAELRQRKRFSFFYTKSTRTLKAAKVHLIDHLAKFQHSSSDRSIIKQLEKAVGIIEQKIQEIEIKNAELRQRKWFSFLYTQDTRDLEAAKAYMVHRLVKLEHFYDPAKRLSKPVPFNPAQPKPPRLVDRLKMLAGGFFRRLLSSQSKAIEELQKIFEKKEAAYKKIYHKTEFYCSQKEWVRGIEVKPSLAFGNYRVRSKNDSRKGIVNHWKLIKVIEKLRLEGKVRNTPFAKIEELLLDKSDDIDPNRMVSNNTIRGVIRKLFPEEPVILISETPLTEPEITVTAASEAPPTQDSPDFSGIHELSLAELRLYLAFVLLTNQPNDQGSREQPSMRSRFVSHAQYKYKLLEEIGIYARQLMALHFKYLGIAKRKASEYGLLLESFKNLEPNEEDRKSLLGPHEGNHPYLEAVVDQLISDDFKRIKTNYTGNAEQDNFNFIKNLQEDFRRCLSENPSLLTLTEINELAQKDKKVSRLLAYWIGPFLKGEPPPNPMHSLHSRPALENALNKLGLKEKFQDVPLSPSILLDIPDSQREFVITDGEAVKKVMNLPFTDKPTKKMPNDFDKACDKLEENIQRIEARLYTACILFVNPMYYQKWEKKMEEKSKSFSELQCQYHNQLIQEIEECAKLLKFINIAALKEAKECAQKYLEILDRDIQAIRGDGDVLESEQQAVDSGDMMEYIHDVIRYACQARFGYTQHEIHMRHVERMGDKGQEAYEAHCKKSFDEQTLRSMRRSNAIRVVRPHFELTKIVEDIDECLKALEQEPKNCINGLLSVITIEKGKAAVAAAGCPTLVELLGRGGFAGKLLESWVSQPSSRTSSVKPPPDSAETGISFT